MRDVRNMASMKVLLTGGAGYIGSHTALALLEAGHKLVILDNFSNSSPESLKRVVDLAGSNAGDRLSIIKGDIRDTKDIERAFSALAPGDKIEAVIHFAGLKSVSDSAKYPLSYWDVNLGGTLTLVETMQAQRCRTLVFSSSATIYGMPEQLPIPETAKVLPINPYGHSKAAAEQLLANLAESEEGWRIASLRYFNPVGAHPSGRIGEDPSGRPSNLLPFMSQVAIGRQKILQVFGDDWPTPDGSGIRDYIHVMDLAEGHLAALATLVAESPQLLTVNLGSGQGYSVLEVKSAFEKAIGSTIPCEIVKRREGDAPCSVADPSLAQKRLRWKTKRNLDDICQDMWSWQTKNPFGYSSTPQSLPHKKTR